MISFLRRNRSTVGLDIGSGYIKAAVIDHTGAEPEVAELAYIPLVADAIVEGEIMDPSLVADTIQSLLDGMETKSKDVVAAVGGRDVIVKVIKMDRMPEADAREVIQWEAEQHVPFDMESVQLDFQVLDPGGDGLQMNVLLVAAKQELVDQKISLLRGAGLKPAIVDVDAFALHNAFEYNYPDASRNVVMLVNVGHEISTLNILHSGAPVLTRDIPFGTRRLREELRRLHGLSAEDAEEILQSRSEREQQYGDVLSNKCEELAMAIERAVAVLSMEISGRTPGTVYLSGGGARIPTLSETIAERLHLRTEIANPLQRLKVRPSAASLFPIDELAPMLMLPIGLALREA